MLKEIELGHNTEEAIKNIYYIKGECIINHSPVTR